MNTEESECAVIAALFNIPHWMSRNREQISAALFVHDTRRTVVAAVMSDLGQGETPDVWAVTNRVGVALASSVVELAAPSRVPTYSDAQRHLEAIRTAYSRRELAKAHQQAADALLSEPLFAAEGDSDIEAMVEEIMASAGKMPGKLMKRRHVKDIIPAVFDQIEARRLNPGKLAGIATGLPTLDKHTSGAMPGQVWVFAGLPGDGKSTIMQQCAETAAYAGHRVDWYGLEMPDEETVFRLLSSGGGVDNDHLYSGILTRAEQEALAKAVQRLKDSPVHLVSTDNHTATDIIADIARSDAEIVVLDYLQLLEDEARKGGTTEEMIASVSRRLKRVARQTGKTIYTASQLNDTGKLRGSRAIGQDADKVFLINKCAMEGGEAGEFDDAKRNLWCDKNRGGRRHWELPLHFLGHVFQFKEVPLP